MAELNDTYTLVLTLLAMIAAQTAALPSLFIFSGGFALITASVLWFTLAKK